MSQIGLYLPPDVRKRLEKLRIELAVKEQKIPSISGIVTRALEEFLYREEEKAKT